MNKLPEDDLHAFVDGRLTGADAERVRRALDEDLDAAATSQAWMAQRDAIRRAFPAGPTGELPPSLLAAAERAEHLRQTANASWRWGGIAASVLVAFGVGWFANARFGQPGALASGVQSAHLFARQASAAYVVFQPEVRHPVEVTAAQQEHLVQWLSKRLGRPLKVPVLTTQGYELMGGRLLPGDNGARAQFMYQNAAGQRLTLYVGAVKAGAGSENLETSFRFLDDGPVPVFYWVDRGFGYALSAQLPRAALQDIAQAVYAQL